MLTIGTHFSFGPWESTLAALGAYRIEADRDTGLPCASLRWWHPLSWAALVAVSVAAAWDASGGVDARATAFRDAWSFYRLSIW